MKSNRLAVITSALLLGGIMMAIYFREPAEQTAVDPTQGSALGLAGLFGIAIAMLVVRLTLEDK